jgi:hypothetical protein
MSARRGKPSLRQIDRWYVDHFSAKYDDDEGPCAPTFAAVRRDYERFAALVVRLRDALRDPFAPGNAAIIAFSDEGFGEYGELNGDVTANGSTIGGLGEALVWGLAGADPAELERLRASHREAPALQAVNE